MKLATGLYIYSDTVKTLLKLVSKFKDSFETDFLFSVDPQSSRTVSEYI